MLISQKIKRAQLSHAQNQIAQYILNHMEEIDMLSLKDLADKTFTSSATVIRFVKKIGYGSFGEFKDDFCNEINYLNHHFQDVDANFPFAPKDNIQKIANKMAILAKETVDDTLALITHDSLQKAMLILEKAETIHLYAISYPLLYGQEFRMNMKRIGRRVEIESVAGEEYFTLGLLGEKDCAVFLSYSGETAKLVYMARKVKQLHIPCIVVSSIGQNSLKEYADVVLQLSTREKLYSKIGGFANEYSMKLILDILYACVFSRQYEKNLHKKVEISKFSERGRVSTSAILKESEEFL